jgi:carboxypeptidase Taq
MLSKFYSHLDEIYRLSCIRGVLEWDQQVCLPPRGAMERADHLELMSKLLHQRLTDPGFIDLVHTLSEGPDLSADDRVNVAELKRTIARQGKMPETFVAERSRVTSIAYTEWTKARPANDFARVRPHLSRIVELARAEAELVGYTEHPYDALLDSYEPQARLSQIKPLLLTLGQELATLVPTITERTKGTAVTKGSFPEAVQVALCTRVLTDVGYNFESGRLDKTHHPFQASLGSEDIRLTTRYDESNYLSALFTALHEAGHAMYEDGLRKEFRGRPLGQPISLGIHESQSRFWENIVGRSPAFARYLHKLLAEYLPAEHQRTGWESIWREVNRVSPSLIRVEADEVTYSLHVVIRLLLEEALLKGDVEVDDLPGAWGDLYEKYLGVRSATDADGVLQDVHWYGGMIGYFPTYALGNLYGALMLEALRGAIPGFDEGVKRGDFRPIYDWLRTNVHQHGMRYTGPELIRRIAGTELSAGPFIQYIKTKFALG